MTKKSSLRKKRRGPRRRAIFKRDKYKCRYCGNVAEVVDHVIPYAYSQDSSLSNLVASCRVCNSLASDFMFGTLKEKREYILKERERRKARGRHLRRGRGVLVAICHCGRRFAPGVKGATNLHCGKCAGRLRSL